MGKRTQTLDKGLVVLAPHSQVSGLLPIGCLIVIGDQAYHCCVIGKHNDGVGVVPGRAVMSEQGVQEGTEHTPLRVPRVEDQHGGCVLTVRKSRIHLEREVFSPTVFSLVRSFEGTMVLNTEL